MGASLRFASLQMNDSFKPVMDGAAVCAENYTRWLNAAGHAAAAVVPMVPGFADSGPYPVIRYFSVAVPGHAPHRFGLPSFDPFLRGQLRSWIMNHAEQVPLVVHTHAPFVSARLAGRVVRWWRDQGGKAVLVATVHIKYQADLESSIGKRFSGSTARSIRRHARVVDALWTPNDQTAELLRRNGFEGRIDIVPNGADFAPPQDAERAALRAAGAAAMGLTDETQLLLFVGQMLWQKNIRLLIEALTELAAMNTPPWRMVFAGDGVNLNEIREAAQAAGLANRVEFPGLILDQNELRAMYARASLLLFPATTDHSPWVVREAAAFGVPSILAAGGDAARDTIDGRNAFHVRTDPEAMARMIWTLLRDPDRARSVGDNARSEVFLDWKRAVERVAVRYGALIERCC